MVSNTTLAKLILHLENNIQFDILKLTLILDAIQILKAYLNLDIVTQEVL
jgi:hypothetical protein